MIKLDFRETKEEWSWSSSKGAIMSSRLVICEVSLESSLWQLHVDENSVRKFSCE